MTPSEHVSHDLALLKPRDIFRALERLRAHRPRVHCITNAVAQELTANVLLALGAIPSMTIAPEEVESFARSADALLINLGTLDDVRRQSIPLALAGAKGARRPVILDPVFVDRSPVRLAYARDLLGWDHLRPDLIKVNGAELAALGDLQAHSRAGDYALAVTGDPDLVMSGERQLGLANGTALLSRVTATGCAVGAVMGAFAAVLDDPLIAAGTALSVFNIAAEQAATVAQGPGSLMPALLDRLHGLSADEISTHLRLVPQPSATTNSGEPS